MCVVRILYKFIYQNVYLFCLADITAEELFNMFFGVGFPQQEFYMRRPGGRWMRQSEAQAQHAHSQVEQKDALRVNTISKIFFFYHDVTFFSKQMDTPHFSRCYQFCY